MFRLTYARSDDAYISAMQQRSRRVHSLLIPATLIAALGACAHPAPPRPTPRPTATAVLAETNGHYAALQLTALALLAADSVPSVEPSETAQAAARLLAERIASMRGDFEATTAAMTTGELETTESLWMRLAMSHAALEILYDDARSLASDPLATSAELRDLALQLEGVLELARVSSGLAAGRLSGGGSPPAPASGAPPRVIPRGAASL